MKFQNQRKIVRGRKCLKKNQKEKISEKTSREKETVMNRRPVFQAKKTSGGCVVVVIFFSASFWVETTT